MALILLSPVLILLAVTIRVILGPPILYTQLRSGLNGKPFTLLKFRSMTTARNSKGEMLADEERMTRFGHILRSTSPDELPQLVNVLRGQMCLVGPRPLLPEYLPLYSAEQARRHSVRPGLTGLAQVNGRNQLTWEQKFTYDVWYVDHVSLWLDLNIMLKTARKIISRQGVVQDNHSTAEKFTGTKLEQ